MSERGPCDEITDAIRKEEYNIKSDSPSSATRRYFILVSTFSTSSDKCITQILIYEYK